MTLVAIPSGCGAGSAWCLSIQMPIAASQHDAVKDFVGKKVCLGLRPKALTLTDKATPERAAVSFKGTIEVSELLGEEVLAHVSSGPHKFIVSIDPHVMQDMDENIEVSPTPERAHVFDAESGRNLTLPEHVKPGGDSAD